MDKTDVLIEKEIKKEIDNWDKVKCALCGKVILMSDADTIYDQSAWICKRGKCK